MNNANPKINRAERPDKSLFFAMMGVFFLLFAAASAYWAFYNYGEYSQTMAFVAELKTQSEQFLTPDGKKEKESRIFSLNSRAARYKLEMILSGAGSFMFSGIALLLFTKSLKNRNRKNFYREINWRERSMPTVRLEVRYTNFQNYLLIALSLFFVLMSALIFYQTLTSQFSSMRDIIIKGAFCICLLGIVFFLVFLTIRARRQAVKLFDASGITRGDGRHFYWAEFCGVITQTARNRFGRTYTWRKELAFSDGETAWLIPQRIKNSNEVYEFISKLPDAVFLKNI